MRTCRASCAARFGPEPEAARQQVRLEDRLEHDLHGGLHDPVADRGDRQRSPLVAARLGDVHPPGRERAEPPLPQLRLQLVEQPGDPVLLDVGEGGPVDARCAVVAAHLAPRPLQDVPAVDLVIQRVEPSSGIGLGRPVERMLQGTDRVETSSTPGVGLATTALTGHSLLSTHGRSSGPSLTGGCVVRPARSVLRPPPTPSRLVAHFPALPVIGRHAPVTPQSPGRGGPPQFPPSPSERSTPSTPGSSSRLHSRVFTASMAFALRDGARLSLDPALRGHIHGAAGFA